MEIREHTTPDMLEKYSFLWSEVRLILGAIALLLGGIPVVFAILPLSTFSGLVGSLLNIAWLISGIASGYMLYRFWMGGKTVFGGRERYDIIAFWVSVVTGINLGITGLLGTNIGMSISSNRIVFILAAIVYAVVAVYLYRRWVASGKKLFGSPRITVEPMDTSTM